jgi:hypothetical protein
MDFDFKNNHGYVLDSNSIIYKTIDYGKTWDSVNVSTIQYLGINLLLDGINSFALNVNDKIVVNMDIAIIDSNKVQLFNNQMEESENHYDNISNHVWLPLYEIFINTNCYTGFNRVKYLSNGMGICIGYSICDTPNYPVQKTVFYPTPGMAVTRDYGKTWNRYVYGLDGSKNVYFDIDGYGDSTFYAVGTYGTIIKSGNLSVSISENVVSDNVSIYPNPAEEELYITSKTIKIKDIYMYDVVGKKISRYPINGTNTAINISYLQKGMYFLKIETENGTVTKRFLKE